MEKGETEREEREKVACIGIGCFLWKAGFVLVSLALKQRNYALAKYQ
jgi:hypothetical protein